MKSDEQIGFRIASVLKKNFFELCKKLDKSPTSVLVMLIKHFVDNPSILENNNQDSQNELEMMRQKLQEHDAKIKVLEQRLVGEFTA
jgi:hypothetical protein